MLMVIFGAGASYDSLDAKPPGARQPGWIIDEEFRPPLANELFGYRGMFADAMARFAKLQPIVPLLRQPRGKNIETILRELQSEANDYPERHRQLMAVRYYLHYMLWECERNWKAASKNVTNYKALLDKINRWRTGKEVSLVTFNYDTLLEDAMPSVGLTVTKLDDYVFGDPAYKVFKLHGSVNWARIVETAVPYRDVNPWVVASDHIERAARLRITDDFVIINQHPCGTWENRFGLVPAVAVPVEKKAYFECPPRHLVELERLLPRVSKILLIGWRATEDHFLELLTKHLKGPIRALVVAGSEGEARNVAIGLKNGPLAKIAFDWEVSPGGFTEFIVNQRADILLERP